MDISQPKALVSMFGPQKQDKLIGSFVSVMTPDDFAQRLLNKGFESEEQACGELANIQEHGDIKDAYYFSGMIKKQPEILFKIIRSGAKDLFTKLVGANALYPNGESLDLNSLRENGTNKSLKEVIGECFEEANGLQDDNKTLHTLHSIFKKLAYGGDMTMANQTAGEAAKKLGRTFTDAEQAAWSTFIGCFESYYLSQNEKTRQKISTAWNIGTFVVEGVALGSNYVSGKAWNLLPEGVRKNISSNAEQFQLGLKMYNEYYRICNRTDPEHRLQVLPPMGSTPQQIKEFYNEWAQFLESAPGFVLEDDFFFWLGNNEKYATDKLDSELISGKNDPEIIRNLIRCMAENKDQGAYKLLISYILDSSFGILLDNDAHIEQLLKTGLSMANGSNLEGQMFVINKWIDEVIAEKEDSLKRERAGSLKRKFEELKNTLITEPEIDIASLRKRISDVRVHVSSMHQINPELLTGWDSSIKQNKDQIARNLNALLNVIERDVNRLDPAYEGAKSFSKTETNESILALVEKQLTFVEYLKDRGVQKVIPLFYGLVDERSKEMCYATNLFVGSENVSNRQTYGCMTSLFKDIVTNKGEYQTFAKCFNKKSYRPLSDFVPVVEKARAEWEKNNPPKEIEHKAGNQKEKQPKSYPGPGSSAASPSTPNPTDDDKKSISTPPAGSKGGGGNPDCGSGQPQGPSGQPQGPVVTPPKDPAPSFWSTGLGKLTMFGIAGAVLTCLAYACRQQIVASLAAPRFTGVDSVVREFLSTQYEAVKSHLWNR